MNKKVTNRPLPQNSPMRKRRLLSSSLFGFFVNVFVCSGCLCWMFSETAFTVVFSSFQFLFFVFFFFFFEGGGHVSRVTWSRCFFFVSFCFEVTDPLCVLGGLACSRACLSTRATLRPILGQKSSSLHLIRSLIPGNTVFTPV